MQEATNRSTVLVLDDEKNIRESIKLALTQEDMHVVLAHDVAMASRVLRESMVDVLVLDIRLDDLDGITFLQRLRADGVDVPVVFISGHATLTEAAQAVRMGAFDFIEKPFTAEKIAVTVRRCLEHSELRQRLRLMEQQLRTTDIVGQSRAIRNLVDDVVRVAASNASVLIQGESGTGKELVAATIHARSTRAAGPLVKVNCSAIPETLLESELFGHERGAFSGAMNARKGLFELAHRGSIFLDEVADLSLAAQAKILRVLQSGDIQKVGGSSAIKVDVRVIAATHKDLKQCVADGSFRGDLYYRLNVIPIRVPSLRERPDDIPLLASFLIGSLCVKNNLRPKKFDEAVIRALVAYPWPGNVRELQNAVERMLIMSGDVVTTDDLPEEIRNMQVHANSPSSLAQYRDQAERDFIVAALKRQHGNITKAAVELGVGRTYLHRRLVVLGIEKKDVY